LSLQDRHFRYLTRRDTLNARKIQVTVGGQTKTVTVDIVSPPTATPPPPPNAPASSTSATSPVSALESHKPSVAHQSNAAKATTRPPGGATRTNPSLQWPTDPDKVDHHLADIDHLRALNFGFH